MKNKKILFLIELLSFSIIFIITSGAEYDWLTYNNDNFNSGAQTGTGYFNTRNITVITNNIDGMDYQPLVADIDADSYNEIVIFSGSYLKIFDYELNLIDEKYIGNPQGQFDIENMDSDPYIEIISVVDSNNIDYYQVWEYNGTAFNLDQNFSVNSQGGYQDIKCTDFDGDNEKECIFRDYHGIVHSYQLNATSANDDELNINISDDGITSSNVNLPPGIVDFDNDGDLDSLLWFNDNFTVIDSNKNVVLSRDVGTLYAISQSGPITFLGLEFVNLDKVGDYEIAVSWRNDYVKWHSYKTEIYLALYKSSGDVIFKKTFDFWNSNPCFNDNHHCIGYGSNFFVTDYDNDGYDDIGIYLDDSFYSTYGTYIKIFNRNGTEIASNDAIVEEKTMVEEAVTVADMDNDNEFELILQKAIYNLDGSTVYNFSPVLSEQVPIAVDIDKNNGLDLIWTKSSQTKFFIDDFGTIKISNISINPINPSVDDDLNCSFILTGYDILIVNVTWYKNNIKYKNETIACNKNELCTTSKISSTETSKNEEWKCSVVAFTNEKKSFIKSDAVTILGSFSECLDYGNNIQSLGISAGKSILENITKITINEGMNFQTLVGDIDGDNENEIVIFSNDYLKIYNKNLELENEKLVGALLGQFDLENMDDDDYIEIIAIIKNNGDDNFAIFEYDGTNFKIETTFNVTSQGGYQDIRCLDFDNDNEKECLYRDYYGVVHSYQIDAKSSDDELNVDINDGEVIGSNVNLPPIIVDFDRDDDLDALFWFNDNFVIVDPNKNIVFSKDVGTLRSITSDPSFLGLKFVNLNKAGDYEIAVAWRNDYVSGVSYKTDIYLRLYDSSGNIIFTKTFDFGGSYCYLNDNKHCIGYGSDFFIVDYDNDGYDDIGIYLDDVFYSTYGSYIKFFNKYGDEIASNNVDVEEGNMIEEIVTLADMDSDNELELILQKSIYDLDGNTIHNFSDNLDRQVSLPVDVDKDGFLDLIWTEEGKTILYLTNKTTSPEESLLEKYAPVLYFHPDEQFFPTTIYAMLNESDLRYGNDSIEIEMPVSKEDLTDAINDQYLDMRNASPGYHPFETDPNPIRFNEYINNIYGREFSPDNEHIVLQYWFFYPYNNWINNHEGDWEMIQLTLNKTTKEPILATYSIHLGGQKHNWSDVLKSETHPKVFVTKGGHGNWAIPGNHSFGSGMFGIEICPFNDETSANGKLLLNTDYNLIQINDNTSWVGFNGKWGEVETLKLPGTLGCNSPKNRQSGKIWNKPIEWGNNPNSPGLIACTGSPVNLHVYDSKGNHLGVNNDGEIETEIPNTYLYIPSDDGKELVVIPTTEELSFVITATDEGKFNFSLGKNEGNTSNKIIVEYHNIEVTNQTIATVNITSTNPNFIMQIDEDGDGTIDTTTEPNNTTIEGNHTNTEVDTDKDGIADSIDNCPNLHNPNQITDFDNDGFYNLLCNGIDCNDNNSLINPNAAEICNDGVDQNCDGEDAPSVRYNLSSIITNIKNLTILINGLTNFNVSGEQIVQFKDNNEIIIEFTHNFSLTTLNLTNILINTTNINNKGAMLIKGLKLQENKTKIVYIDKMSNSNKVCIKDEEINSIIEISDNCNNNSEFSVVCDGSLQNNYSCSLNGSRYKITGLTHSGVIEYEVSEEQSSSTATSSGGSCYYKWNCSEWSSCIENKQTRVCKNIGTCSDSYRKPEEVRDCISTPKTEEKILNTSIEKLESFDEEKKNISREEKDLSEITGNIVKVHKANKQKGMLVTLSIVVGGLGIYLPLFNKRGGRRWKK